MLTENDKKRIQEEEKYRSQVREELKGKPAKKKSRGKGCLLLLLLLFLIPVMVAIVSPSDDSKSGSGTAASPTKTEEQRAREEELENQKIDKLAQTFCENRSDGLPYFDLHAIAEDINGERDNEVIYNTTRKPTAEDCRTTAKYCFNLWGEKDCQRIAEEKIWIGMNNYQLNWSWGNPRDRNNTVTSFGVSSQWVYDDFGPYVYLEGDNKENMLVTSWQD